MKKIWIVMVIVLCVSLFSACQSNQKDVPSKLIIEETSKNIKKEIVDTKMVSDTFSVLQDANWINAKVDMSRPADYLLHFEIKKSEKKAALYQVWLSPNKKQYEVVIDELSKYVKLSEKESETLKRAIEK